MFFRAQCETKTNWIKYLQYNNNITLGSNIPHTGDPDLSITLHQVLHVPFDCVQMFLDVIEVLNGLICSHTSCISLVLG